MQETLRLDMESEREELLHRLSHEREELLARYEAEKEELSEEITALQQERDESLLQAENEKQQVGEGARGIGTAASPGLGEAPINCSRELGPDPGRRSAL